MEPGFFRPLNRVMLALWRAGLGGAVNATHRTTGRIMVLGTLGRRSGLLRRTPLNYAPGDGEVFCLAGFGPRTQWLRNLRAQPAAEVWLPQGRFLARAHEVTVPDERLRRLRQVLQASGFASRTFAGIDPWEVADADLAEQTRDYVVVRLRLEERLPDPDTTRARRAAVGLGMGLGAVAGWFLLVAARSRRGRARRPS